MFFVFLAIKREFEDAIGTRWRRMNSQNEALDETIVTVSKSSNKGIYFSISYFSVFNYLNLNSVFDLEEWFDNFVG